MSARVWQDTIAALLPALTVIGLARAVAPDTDPLPSYVTSISEQLDSRVAQTLAQLDGTGRQLLALRSYLRSSPHLAERWSWTQEQIARIIDILNSGASHRTHTPETIKILMDHYSQRR